MSLGLVPYGEAFELQRSLAGAVSQGAIPETVIFLEHPPVVTIGRRTETEQRAPRPRQRGGRDRRDRPRRQVDVSRARASSSATRSSTSKPRQGREALRARPRGGAHPHARRLRAPGYALRGPDGRLDAAGGGQGPRKIASIGVHVSRWVTTHGYALNVDLDPAPFTEWITACGLEDAAFTTMARELEPAGHRRGRLAGRDRGDRRGLRASSSRSSRPTTARVSGGSPSTPRSRPVSVDALTVLAPARRGRDSPRDSLVGRCPSARSVRTASLRLRRLTSATSACVAAARVSFDGGRRCRDRFLRAPDAARRRTAPSPAPTKHVLRPRRAVDEVPRPQPSLLALDDQQTLAREDEEVLLRVLGVVHALGSPGRRMPTPIPSWSNRAFSPSNGA